MAETAGDLIKDALSEITVLGAEAPVEATDAQTGIRYMNRMMAAFDADGIDLGYTEVSDFADIVTVAAGAIQGVVTNLASLLWTQYSNGEMVPASLAIRAKNDRDTLLNIAFTIGQTEYPSTLPIGSGNEGDSTYVTNHFYKDLQSTILAETNGSIGLEESTT